VAAASCTRMDVVEGWSVIEDAELESRREAVAELGAAMRSLSEAVVRAEADIPELRAAAAAARSLADRLWLTARGLRQVPSVDDLAGGTRFFSLGTGIGHPVSPPLRLAEEPDGTLVGQATLGARLEGPPGMLHGGMIALLFDEMLGWAAARAHAHGMTAQLEVTYRRAVPLDAEIVIVARTTSTEGRKVWTEATLARADDPGTLLATARALFVRPREELSREYFSGLVDAAGRPAPGADSWQAPTA